MQFYRNGYNLPTKGSISSETKSCPVPNVTAQVIKLSPSLLLSEASYYRNCYLAVELHIASDGNNFATKLFRV